jgi:VCBS repeat-containing protein
VTAGPSNGSLTNNSDGTFSYTGNLNFVGADSFTYTVEDNDGQLSSDITVTINVSDVNDAPAGTNKTVATLEDTDFVFAASDFGFTDSSDSPANNLLKIIITSAPTNGDLFLDSNGDGIIDGGETLINLDSIAITDINAGKLKFKPALNGNGSSYDSFTFQVQDDGGTANSGVDTDPSANTITIDVTPQNDPASIGGNTAGSAAEGVVVTGTLTATDADGLTDGSYFSISGTPASNGTPGIDAASGAWTYTPSDANWFGSDSFEVTVTDDEGGTTTQIVSITLSNVNDPAVISGDNTGTVTKSLDVDLLLKTSGTLTITDADPGESSFLPASITGNYGVISINTSGTWSYSADNSQATIQALSGSQALLDTFTIMSADGTTHNIAITINGVDTPPSVIIPITPEPEQPTTPPTEEPDDENTSEIEETNDTNETNDTENTTETIFDNSNSLIPAFITATPTPLTPNDLFLSVLSERPSTIKTTDDVKPSVEITQTFLQELASFWKDDGIATVDPSDSSTSSPEFLDDLDKMLQDLDESEKAKEKELELSAEAITGVSITLTAGFVSWALRAGSLMASLLAAMPAWRHLDPMPILAANEKDQKESLPIEHDLDNIQNEKTENKVDELFER